MEGLIAYGVALALAGGALAAACVAVAARSLFLASIAMAVCAALAAGALVGMGVDAPALGLALFGIGFAPTVLFSGLLLSTRVTRAKVRGAWWGLGAGALVLAALGSSVIEVAPRADAIAPAPFSPWLALIVLAGAAACYGVLGYGERSAFDRPDEGER